MPLKMKLKPYEALIINGASIRNGSRNMSFIIETPCQFLRETELMHESEADTPCKKLCVTLQVIHLTEDPSEAEHLLFAQAAEIMKVMPASGNFMAEIQDALAEKQTYNALKLGRELIKFEQEWFEAQSLIAKAVA